MQCDVPSFAASLFTEGKTVAVMVRIQVSVMGEAEYCLGGLCNLATDRQSETVCEVSFS